MVLAGVFATAAAMGIGRFVFTPLLPGMMNALHLSASDAGFIASANFLGYLAGAFAAAGGWAHGHERRLMLCGLLVNAVLVAAMGFDMGVPGFSAIRFLGGVASAFSLIFVTAILFSHSLAARRTDLRTVHFNGIGIGIAVSGLTTGMTYYLGMGWQAGWFIAAIPAALAFAAAFLLMDQPTLSSRGGREGSMPRDPALYRVIAAYGAFGFGYIITMTFLVAMMRADGASPIFETLVWMATGLAVVVAAPFWTRVTARLGHALSWALAFVIEALGVLASMAGGSAGPLVAGILLGGTFVAITALGIHIGNELAPNAPRKVFAFMTGIFGVGQIIGPIFAGIVADRTGGFQMPSLIAAIVLLISALLAWDAGRIMKARQRG